MPEHLIGEPTGHDTAALARFALDRDSLRPDIREAIEPYFLRPTDPDSAFARDRSDLPPIAPSPPGLRGAHPAIVPAIPHQKPMEGAKLEAGPRVDCADWTSASLNPAPFRLWVCAGDPDDPTDIGAMFGLAGDLVAETRELLQAMSRPRPEGMGAPIPDRAFAGRHPDEDEDIDIYILDDDFFAPDRGEGDHAMTYGLGGTAVPSAPFAGTTSSGHILMASRILADPEQFLNILAHESFHVQQFARHIDPDGDLDWLVESTAQWAGGHFVPASARKMHTGMLPTMQLRTQQLTATIPEDHPYYGYFWHLFMQQQAGTDAIFDVWDSLAGRYGPEDYDVMLDAIDRHTPWSTSLPEFAMRLLNAALPGDPISPRFVHEDGLFPDGLMPDFAAAGLADTVKSAPLVLGFGTDPTVSQSVPPLGYRFHQVIVAASDGTASGLAIEPDAALGATAGARLEALVKGDEGTYQRHVVDLEEGIRFCGASEAILVLSNSSRTDTVTGSVTIIREAAEECDLGGGLNWHFSGTMGSGASALPWPYRATATLDGTLQVAVGPAQTRALDAGRIVDPEVVEKRMNHPLGEEWAERIEWQEFYPDAGSTWEFSGSYVFERCDRGSASACWPITTQQFAASGPVDSLEIVTVAGRPVLRAVVPVTTTIVSDDAGTRTESWSLTLGCAASAIDWWTLGHDFAMKTPMFAGSGTMHGPSDASDLAGTWTDEGSAIGFDCRQAWDPPTQPGTQSAKLEILGEVSLARG